METVIMVGPEGEVEVEPKHVEAAFSSGLKLRDQKEMSTWDALKAGAKRGWDVLASQETGFEQEPVSLEQEQAWSEHPVAYGIGVAGGLAPAIGAGAAVVGGAAYGVKKGMQQAAPVAGPSKLAAQQAYRETMKSETIPDVAGVVKPVVGAVRGAKAALGQIPETRREQANLAKLEAGTASREAGAVNPQAQRPMLGVELLEPGMTPEKQAIAERSATIAPSQIRAKPLADVMAMGTSRRQEARSFLPEQAAEEITPGLKSSFEALRKGKGAAYGALHEEAAGQYQPEQGVAIPGRLSSILSTAQSTKGITGPTSGAIDTAKQIIEDGPSPYGLTPGKFVESTPQEQYKRLKAAREYLGAHIRQVQKNKDPNIINTPSLNMLKQAHDEMDTVMKAIPSQKKADELYRESMKAKGAFYDAMEFGKGEKKTIDVPTVKRLFGNNDKAYRLREGIETMKAFLQKYGDDIVPEKRKEMEAVVSRFESLRQQAEDKRLIEGVGKMQGPTSPAFERTESLRSAKGLPKDIFTSPATSMNAADEFIASRASQHFGAKFEGLQGQEKNALVRLLMWRQQNPEATMTEEESMFKKILKGK
jgi:hypothetical protein